jgi:hypothetical protein
MQPVKRFLREPLLHFLLLGAVLFAAFQFTGRARAPERKVIEITPGVVEHLGTTFARTWQRRPTPEEMAGLIRDYLRDEVAYREGLALGLDRDDSIIRRRMRQKLEMLSEETWASLEADDAVLEAYLRAHAGTYAQDPSVAFAQVFINPERHAADLEATVSSLRERLGAAGVTPGQAAEWGDATMLPADMPLAPRWQVAREFGDAFADAVVALEPGVWSGPIRSGFGLHFVRVSERHLGRMPELSEVRDTVRRDWQADRTRELRDQLYAELLSGYEIIVPEGVAGAGQP